MAFVWLHGRSNRDFRPFLAVFRSPRFYRLKNVPESPICSYRSENTRFRVSHSPPDGARIRDPPIFYPCSLLVHNCGSRVFVRRAHADFCFGPPAEYLVCFCATRPEFADAFVFFFFYLFCCFAWAKGSTFVK
jgi:hypothetical protein